MDTEQAIGWLHRRAGFGLHGVQLASAVDRGIEAELARFTMIDELVDRPDADPWEGLELDPQNGGRAQAVRAWVQHLVDSDQPFRDRRTWMLHGWLVSSMDKVNNPDAMVDQIRLFMADGGGSYPDLLRRITTDRAMLIYLDGRSSTGAAPNENYGRELLELFALGVGNYEERDVQAASRALTGWIVARRLGESRFVPSRHDNSGQLLLDVDGVNDVDSVIDAVTSHPAHPTFVARRIADEYLGALDPTLLPEVTETLAATYVANGFEVDPVIVAAIELGLSGTTAPRVLDPIPWLMICIRTTGVRLAPLLRTMQGGIQAMGQVPLFPPGVNGWPSGSDWFVNSSLVARTKVAAQIADATPDDEPIRIAATDGDNDEVARLLGLAEPFGAATTAAITAAATPTASLTLALISPENLLS